MSRWLHCDADCPGRPWFKVPKGRTYRCRCGRVWRFEGSRYTKTWKLVSPPQDEPEEKR